MNGPIFLLFSFLFWCRHFFLGWKGCFIKTQKNTSKKLGPKVCWPKKKLGPEMLGDFQGNYYFILLFRLNQRSGPINWKKALTRLGEGSIKNENLSTKRGKGYSPPLFPTSFSVLFICPTTNDHIFCLAH